MTFVAICLAVAALAEIVRHVLAIRHARRLRELERREAAARVALELETRQIILRRVRARTGFMRAAYRGVGFYPDELAGDGTIEVRGRVVASGYLPDDVTARIVEQFQPVDDKSIETCRARFEHDEYFPAAPEGTIPP